MKTLLTFLLFVSLAPAAPFTPWEPTPHAGEKSLDLLLDERFGPGQWSQRPDPSIFPFQLTFVETIASYAGASQSFHWVEVDGGWAACNTSSGHPDVGTMCSVPAMNPGGRTHVLAFDVAGQPDWTILAFEDLPEDSPQVDWDFNDYVIALRFDSTPVEGVPEPATVVLLGAGLLALTAWRLTRCPSA